MNDSAINHAPDAFAPGHLGELTQLIPPEMVDAALATAGGKEQRLRRLPSRVVIYLLLAGALFTGQGRRQVFSRMIAGRGTPTVVPSGAAMTTAMRRVGPKPLRELFTFFTGSALNGATGSVRFAGHLVVSIDGTQIAIPDTEANKVPFPKPRGGPNGEAGYPMITDGRDHRRRFPLGHRSGVRQRQGRGTDLRPPSGRCPATGYAAARGPELRHLQVLRRHHRDRGRVLDSRQDRARGHETTSHHDPA